MTNGLVSVVIPTYKRSEMLPRAVKSVLDQTYSNVEVIVVNDNDPDDEFTAATKKQLEAITDKRVRFVQQDKHLNGSAARNKGIESAKGEFVAFLDDDDVWHSDKLKKQMAVFESDSSVGLVYTGSKAIYVNDKVSYAIIPKQKGDLKKEILLGNCIGTTSTVAVKREIITGVGMFDVKMPALQDYDLWIRICQKTKIGFVAEELIDYYNFRDGEQVSSDTSKYETAFARLNEKYADLLSGLTPEERKKRENYETFSLANKALRNNDKKKGRAYLKKVMKNGFNKKALAMYVASPFGYGAILRLRKLV